MAVIKFNYLVHLGTKIIEVKATDADDPTTANADLRYSLTRDGETSAFKIDSVTGRLASVAFIMISFVQQQCFFLLLPS